MAELLLMDGPTESVFKTVPLARPFVTAPFKQYSDNLPSAASCVRIGYLLSTVNSVCLSTFPVNYLPL